MLYLSRPRKFTVDILVAFIHVDLHLLGKVELVYQQDSKSKIYQMLVTKHSKNLILSFFWQQWI
jgi:hypothetical protein